MSGDPVEEGGQAVRQGFVQALQTAHTTAALMRGRGGDARSVAEHGQRMRLAETRERRSLIEHGIRVRAALEAAQQARELNTARVEEVQARTRRDGETHRMDQRVKRRQIERADADLTRRAAAGEQEYRHREEIHSAQKAAYTNRETRADELHELDKQYKELSIEIRRRAAGLTDSLTETGADGEALAATAAFAAADAAEDLSAGHAAAAAAYRERFIDDTGRDIDDLLGEDRPTVQDRRAGHSIEIVEADLVEAGEVGPATPELVAAVEIVDAEVVADPEAELEGPTPAPSRRSPSFSLDDAADLAAELSTATHLDHRIGDPDADIDYETDDGAVIGAAVTTSGVEDADPTAAFDLDFAAGLTANGPMRARVPEVDL